MTAESPRTAGVLKNLELAGIPLQAGDAERIAGFLGRLRELAPPALSTDPWALPASAEWPRG